MPDRFCPSSFGSLRFLCLSKVLTYPSPRAEGMERLDGILGLHVDDFVGGGEGMSLWLWKDGTMCPRECRALLPG